MRLGERVETRDALLYVGTYVQNGKMETWRELTELVEMTPGRLELLSEESHRIMPSACGQMISEVPCAMRQVHIDRYSSP